MEMRNEIPGFARETEETLSLMEDKECDVIKCRWLQVDFQSRPQQAKTTAVLTAAKN